MKKRTKEYVAIFKTTGIFVLALGIHLSAANALAQLSDVTAPQSNKYTLAYISNIDGFDAILLHGAGPDQMIYTCSSSNEMILTPSVDHWNMSFCFLIDQGTVDRSLHQLSLSRSRDGIWRTEHESLATLPGASWPVRSKDGGILLVMPDESTLSSGKVTGLFKLVDGSIQTIQSAEEKYKHYWPLVSPSGDKLFYRQSAVPQEGIESPFWSRMIERDLNDQGLAFHFVDEPIYLEQWVTEGIIYSVKLGDAARSRVYRLYDPENGQERELYRGSVWQARFSDDLSHLAVLRAQPGNESFFDIYLVDMNTGSERNMSNTPRLSESLIGWLPQLR
jgi:hypothetical protein